ncbi:NADH-quinone oxidoreductase subunit J [Bdellovibrio sp. HCB337]|uniref:NADH-quinone oxidoreductase subunit J n=1 Tax=Bdellovibrio sp. HCB337 TaxID=3394358 RepID=UPI0039A6DBBD
MTADSFLFWMLAAVTLISGLTVVLVSNPIYSALSLAMTMVGVSALFATLGAYFIAGVQLIVYAGAVLVLFVMVLMLFDLKTELATFSRGKLSGILKIATVGILAGFLAGAFGITAELAEKPATAAVQSGAEAAKSLGVLLFTKYVFGFEALGVLLLVIAIGVVGLARSKGGTHAKH